MFQSDRERKRSRKYAEPFHPPIIRAQLYERDGNLCQHCKVELDEADFVELDKGTNNRSHRKLGGNFPTIDHIIPRATGGSDTLDNLRLLCFDCNFNLGKLFEYYYIKTDWILDLHDGYYVVRSLSRAV